MKDQVKSGVRFVAATASAIVAVKEDGTAVAWGDKAEFGADITAVKDDLSTFACLKFVVSAVSYVTKANCSTFGGILRRSGLIKSKFVNMRIIYSIWVFVSIIASGLSLSRVKLAYVLRRTSCGLVRPSGTALGSYFDASGVKMYRPEDVTIFESKGSSLVATRAHKKDSVVCSIPFEMCIISHASGATQGGAMLGQQDMIWDCAGDLRNSVSEEQYSKGHTWDVNLALALLDATCGDGLAGEFWESYTGAYPLPESLTVPFCMKDEQLATFQDEAIMERAKQQKQRLDSLFPTLSDPKLHRMTQHWPHISPLQWAFAMVRSRCFRLGALDWFAVVPIIELANHDSASKSNTRFEVELLGMDMVRDREQMDDDGSLSTTAPLPSGRCILRAKRDICEGEQVLLTYDDGAERVYSNRRLTSQYGFSIASNFQRDEGEVYVSWNWKEDEEAASSMEKPLCVTSFTFQSVVDRLVDATLVWKLGENDDAKNPISAALKKHTDVEVLASQELGGRLRSVTLQVKEEGTAAATATIEEVLWRLLSDTTNALSLLPSSFEENVILLENVPANEVFRVQFQSALRFRMARKSVITACHELVKLALQEF